jgi:hypothetical protein
MVQHGSIGYSAKSHHNCYIHPSADPRYVCYQASLVLEEEVTAEVVVSTWMGMLKDGTGMVEDFFLCCFFSSLGGGGVV